MVVYHLENAIYHIQSGKFMAMPHMMAQANIT
jgi:hypothetical protein